MEHGSSLLSLGNQISLSFSSDVVAQAAWKGSTTPIEASRSADDGAVEEKENIACLKEHDYIGLSTPVKPLLDSKSPNELSLPETDLHLGLGLGFGPSKRDIPAEESEKTLAFPLTQKEGLPKAVMESPRYAFTEGGHALQKPWSNAGSMRPVTAENLNSATSGREFQSSKVSMHVQDYGEGPSRVGNTFYGGHSAALKNGTKRGYTEAMNEPGRFNITTEVRAAAAAVGKNGDADAKALPKHPQGAFIPNWAPSKPTLPAHWQVGLEQSSVHSFGPNKPAPVMTSPRIEKPVADHAPSYKSHDPSEAGKEPVTNEPPPSKGQVVGWPPIRSYRKHTLAKPAEMFVKVNMDGMTVGRKVDLNAHSSYEGLLSALEEMFQPSNNGGTSQAAPGRDNHPSDVKQFRLLHGSDFVLTYEDQDGDWMLVGDVPWSMFVNMVRRLRITRGSEATGLAPRRPDKIK